MGRSSFELSTSKSSFACTHSRKVRLIRWEGALGLRGQQGHPVPHPQHQPAGVYWPSHIIGLQPRLGTTLQNRRNHMRLIVKGFCSSTDETVPNCATVTGGAARGRM